MIISETEKLLRTHATQYPLSEPCDAVKLLYQNEFGGDHLIDPSAGELILRNAPMLRYAALRTHRKRYCPGESCGT